MPSDQVKTTITHEQELRAFSTALARAEDEARQLRGQVRLLRSVVQSAIEWDSHDSEGVPAVWLEGAEDALKETEHDN